MRADEVDVQRVGQRVDEAADEEERRELGEERRRELLLDEALGSELVRDRRFVLRASGDHLFDVFCRLVKRFPGSPDEAEL